MLVRTALVSNREAAFGLFEQVKAIVKSSASQVFLVQMRSVTKYGSADVMFFVREMHIRKRK